MFSPLPLEIIVGHISKNIIIFDLTVLMICYHTKCCDIKDQIKVLELDDFCVSSTFSTLNISNVRRFLVLYLF